MSKHIEWCQADESAVPYYDLKCSCPLPDKIDVVSQFDMTLSSLLYKGYRAADDIEGKHGGILLVSPKGKLVEWLPKNK